MVDIVNMLMVALISTYIVAIVHVIRLRRRKRKFKKERILARDENVELTRKIHGFLVSKGIQETKCLLVSYDRSTTGIVHHPTINNGERLLIGLSDYPNLKNIDLVFLDAILGGFIEGGMVKNTAGYTTITHVTEDEYRHVKLITNKEGVVYEGEFDRFAACLTSLFLKESDIIK